MRSVSVSRRTFGVTIGCVVTAAAYASKHALEEAGRNSSDDAYATLDYGRPLATEAAQNQVVRYYQSLLADAVWLADQDASDLADAHRPRLLRAQLAMELLAPTVEDAS